MEVEKEGQGRRWGEGKEEGEKGIKTQRSFSLYLCVCCSLWWKQDETLLGDEGAINVCAEGTAESTAVMERGELLTERNGRRAREQHRRQKVFKKKKKRER